MDGGLKVAFGWTKQTLRVNGISAAFAADGAMLGAAPGGLFALPTNMGTFTESEFAVVPEVSLTVGCQLTEQLRTRSGCALGVGRGAAGPSAHGADEQNGQRDSTSITVLRVRPVKPPAVDSRLTNGSR